MSSASSALTSASTTRCSNSDNWNKLEKIILRVIHTFLTILPSKKCFFYLYVDRSAKVGMFWNDFSFKTPLSFRGETCNCLRCLESCKEVKVIGQKGIKFCPSYPPLLSPCWHMTVPRLRKSHSIETASPSFLQKYSWLAVPCTIVQQHVGNAISVLELTRKIQGWQNFFLFCHVLCILLYTYHQVRTICPYELSSFWWLPQYSMQCWNCLTSFPSSLSQCIYLDIAYGTMFYKCTTVWY